MTTVRLDRDTAPPCAQVVFDDHLIVVRPCGAPSRQLDNGTPVCLRHSSAAASAARRELGALGFDAPLTAADWAVLKPMLAGESVDMPPPRAVRLRSLLAAWAEDDRVRGCIVPVREGTYRWDDSAFDLGLRALGLRALVNLTTAPDPAHETVAA